MTPFWQAAKRMLRYRRDIAGALAAAAVSAAGLGVGIVGMAPVLDAMIGRRRTLADIAGDFNARSPIDIPQTIIDALPTKPFTAVVVVVIGLSILTLLGSTAAFIHMALSLSVVERTVAHIRRELFRSVIHLPLRTVVASGSSDPVSRIVNDPQQLGAGFSALLGKGVAQVTKGLAAFAAAVFLDWRLTAVTLVIAPVMYTVIRRLGKRIRRASRSALEGQKGLYAAATESLQGLRVVKVHTTERVESARFHKINRTVLKHLLSARMARAIASPTTEAMAVLTLAGLSLIAAKAVYDGELDPSAMFLTFVALGIAGTSLRPLTGILNDIQQSSAAAERIIELLSAEPEPGHDRTLPRLPRHTQTITFSNITFTYPGGDTPAIDDISLTITHGETVAFVGPNGSGKTTVLSLVPRLFDPDSGTLRIDGTDIATASIRSVRRQIAVVTQETVLFAGTIADNIAYGSRGLSREAITDAAIKARAHEFIQEKGGYDAEVGERGLNLSGGQRQRIAIARAIARDPAILILDEATSMIDAESEALIGEALDALAEGRTTLVVAHRLTTVLAADRIIVMDRGRIVDQGSHTELMQRCEVYRSIAKRQLFDDETKA